MCFGLRVDGVSRARGGEGRRVTSDCAETGLDVVKFVFGSRQPFRINFCNVRVHRVSVGRILKTGCRVVGLQLFFGKRRIVVLDVKFQRNPLFLFFSCVYVSSRMYK